MFSISRKLLSNLDWTLLVTVLLISGIGIAAIASATHTPGGPFLTSYVKRQLVWMCVGIAVIVAIQLVDYSILHRYAYLIYIVTIVMLVAVFFLGTFRKGARRWIAVGPVMLQPSEFAKIFLVISLARFLEKRKDFSNLLPYLLIALFVLPPILLIYKQPDLGTSLVLAFIVLIMLFAAGMKWKHLGYLAGSTIVGLPLAWMFALKGYQKDRILVFLNPERDPRGAGYNVIQSRIAIGSGNWAKATDQGDVVFRLFGKGLFEKDTLTSLRFIPEQQTDFIFTAIGEGLGFLGALLVVLLFTFFLYRCVLTAIRAKDRFGALVAIGLSSMFMFHILVNIGMTLGLMPVTGLPLPFMSYGGSSYLTNSIAIGIILNIGMRNKKILF